MDYAQVFENSYKRLMGNSEKADGFIKDFYEIFIHKDPAIRKLLERVDMERQIRMVKLSLLFIYNCHRDRFVNENLSKTAQLHGKNGLNIPVEYYDLWLEALMEAVKEHDDEFDDKVEVSWRMIMSVGTNFMKFFSKKEVELGTGQK